MSEEDKTIATGRLATGEHVKIYPPERKMHMPKVTQGMQISASVVVAVLLFIVGAYTVSVAADNDKLEVAQMKNAEQISQISSDVALIVQAANTRDRDLNDLIKIVSETAKTQQRTTLDVELLKRDVADLKE